MSRRECVFWGWGEPGAGPSLPDHAAGFLRSELGVSGAVVSTPVSLEEVRLRPSALSESVRVFDPALVRPILKELAELARPHFHGREAEALANLTAVDGTVFAALPRMAWALWQDAEHRGVKLHLQFQACKGVPMPRSRPLPTPNRRR